MTGDKELLLSALKGLKGTGGTYYNQAVKQTIDAFDMNSSNTKIAIFMSDGEPSDTITTHTLNLISSSGVIFHTVGYGSKFNSLRTLSDAGTGTVYTATNVDELIEAYEDIYLFSGISTVDNDGDGLYDVFEKNGMTLPNGKVIFTDPFKNDTDGDGLVDGLEVLLKKFDYSRHSYVFELKTDPFASDYSNSGICDYDRVNGTNIYGRSYYVSSLNGDIIDIPVGTVAYGYPNISCGEAFTAKAVDQYFQYRASALIYANGEYWIKVNSGDSYGVWGYIICKEKDFDCLNHLFYSSVTAIEKNEYPNEKYASTTGEACACHRFCDWTTGIDGGCTCFSYDNSIQCEAFAKYVFERVTGKKRGPWTDSIDLSNVDKAREFMRDVPSCSYFRSSSMGHSFIVVSHSEENVTIYHCNFRGYLNVSTPSSCIVQLNTISYEDFSRWFGIICCYTPSIGG